MNLLLLIAQTFLLLCGNHAAKLSHVENTANEIQNGFQSKQRSEPHDNQDSLEQQDEKKGLNQALHSEQSNLDTISQNNISSLDDVRSELSNSHHGNQGFSNKGNTKQDNQNFPSVKSTQLSTQERQSSLASGTSGVSQGANFNGIAGQSSLFIRNNNNNNNINNNNINNNNNDNNNVPQNFGTSVNNIAFGHADSSPREVHFNSQSGIRQDSKLGFHNSQGTLHDGEEYNQSSIVSGSSRGTFEEIGFQQETPVTKPESTRGDGNLVNDHGISNNELTPGFNHGQRTSNSGFRPSQSDNFSNSGYSQDADSALRTTQSSHTTGSSHGTSNTFTHGVSGFNSGSSSGFDNNQGSSNVGFGVRQSGNFANSGNSQVSDSAHRTAQTFHATGSSHGHSNNFVHGVIGSNTDLSPGFENNHGPSNFDFGVGQNDNFANFENSQVRDSALKTSQSSPITDSSHETSNTFVHGVSGSNTGLSPGFEHNQGQSNVGFGVSQNDNFANSRNSQVTGSAFRTAQTSHATGSSHGTPNTFVQGVSGSGFQQNAALLNNAAVGTRFDQSNAIPEALFGQRTTDSSVRFNENNKVSHEQQHFNANTGFRQGNIGTSNNFNQAVSSPQSHSNIRNGFGQSVFNTGVRHSASNQQDQSNAQIYRFNLVRATSVQPNFVNPNNIGSLSTSRGSRAESEFGGLRQTNSIQQTTRGVHPAQFSFIRNQAISSNPTSFGNRIPTSHVTQQHFPATSAHQEHANNAASQGNINSIASLREVNSLGVQTQQKIYNAVRQQSGISSQFNQRPELLQRNQISQESAATGDFFNTPQSSLGRPVIDDSQRQRIFSHGPSSSSNTGNKGFTNSPNSQITNTQTHLNTPSQLNSINQGPVRNFENESKQVPHINNSNPQTSSQFISTSVGNLGVSQNTSLNTGSNTQFPRNQGRVYNNRTVNRSSN